MDRPGPPPNMDELRDDEYMLRELRPPGALELLMVTVGVACAP